MAGWARRLGVSKQCLQQRIDRWGVDVALRLPRGGRAKKLLHLTKTQLEELPIKIPLKAEPRVDGLSDFIYVNRKELEVDSLFSDEEKEKIARIKARRKK